MSTGPRWYCQVQGKVYGPWTDQWLLEQAKCGAIKSDTLVRKDDSGQWVQASQVKGLKGLSTAPATIIAVVQDSPRQVEQSSVALALAIPAVFELIAAPIVGFAVGTNASASLGWMICLSGLISGMILLGFARVIEHLYESVQRLRQIELFLQRDSDDKKREISDGGGT